MRALTVSGEIVQDKLELARENRVTTLGQLAASLSHEVNQPIGAARNNATAALRFLDKEAPDVNEAREALRCVVSDIDHARAVLDRIRDLIKKVPGRRESFHLNDAIQEVIALTRAEVAINGIDARTRLASGLPPIRGDRIQFLQVVLNLVVNATEAMSTIIDGTRELLITTAEHRGEGVLVEVRDSGPGVEPKHLESIFDWFFTTKPNGIGLGLSICRSIVETHGGRMWAEPNQPRGVAFIFTIPAAELERSTRHRGAADQEPPPSLAL